MSRKVVIIDTSILCIWLEVDKMDTCGPSTDQWDSDRVKKKIELEKARKTIFVLPLASIIESGNHIAHAKNHRKECAEKLSELIVMSIDNCSPWAAFSEQDILWSKENLKKLAQDWPIKAARTQSIGDATINDVADFYAKSGYRVEILSGDVELATYTPQVTTEKPRRRKRT